jgi:hypothetical protein
VLQVYEHAVPLQDSEAAFVVLHTSPHALQLLVVVSVVQVVPHVVAVHVHTPFEQVGVGCAQLLPVTQLPAAPHDCGTPPELHWIWPGAQEPEQVPP